MIRDVTVDATHHVKVLYEVKTKDPDLILKFGAGPGQTVLTYRFRDIFSFEEGVSEVRIREYHRIVIEDDTDVRCFQPLSVFPLLR